MNLILTPEQKGLRLLQQRHSEDGQIAINQRAIGRAIGAVNADLQDEGAKPSFNAVLGAICNVLADHLAQLPDDEMRERLVKAVAGELPLQVETRVIQARGN